MKLKIKQASLGSEAVDAVINPANSYGYMGGGVAKYLKETGGDIVEEEAIAQAPIPIGEAYLTKPGSLACKAVIHAVVMENPAEHTTDDKVRHALEAAVELAKRNNFKKIAIPGMGTGVGGLTPEEVAPVMMQVIKQALPNFELVILADINEDVVKAWKAVAEEEQLTFE